MKNAALPEQTSWPSFKALNICQFIGSMNDNLYKLLLVFCFIHIEGPKESTRILAFAGALYVLPFLILATTAGTLADRYSKRTLIIATRMVEVIALLLGLIAFSLENKFLSYAVLFLLACHSSLFAPSKYGIVPELVAKQDISKANGLLTLFTYTAIIIGTFLASFLTDLTHYNFALAALFPLLFSSVALYVSFGIQKTNPSGSQKKVSARLLQELLANLRIIRQKPPLLSAVFGSAFFLFVGSFIQLNIIPYALECLNLTEVQGGYMFLLTAFGIGIGSFLAGKISGKTVEFGLIPIGGLGLAISFFLLWGFSSYLPIVLLLFTLVGVFGGLYLIPLDSYIQVASPATYRGQIVATSNFFGFLGVLASALLLYVTSNILNLAPNKAFFLIGVLVLFALFFLFLSFSEQIFRFYSFLLSACIFPSALKGKELIPLDHPSFFFAPESFRPWIPALLGAQRGRIQIITLKTKESSSFGKKILEKLLPNISISDMKEIYPEGSKGPLLTKALKEDSSFALILSKKTLLEHTKNFISAWKKVSFEKNLSFFQVQMTKKEASNILAYLTTIEEEI